MFEETVDWITAQRTPFCSQIAFDHEATAGFYRNPMWSTWKAFRRDEPHCIFEVLSVVSEETSDLHAIEEALYRAWECFAVPTLNMSALIRYSDAVVLKFVLVSKTSCLPGRYVAGGARYEELISQTYKGRHRDVMGKAPFMLDWAAVGIREEEIEHADLARRVRQRDDDNLALARVFEVIQIVARYQDSVADITVREAVLHNFELIELLLNQLNYKLDFSNRLRPWRILRRGSAVTEAEISEAVRRTAIELPSLIDEYSREHLSWQHS